MGSAALPIRWAEYLQLLLLACWGGMVQRFKCLKSLMFFTSVSTTRCTFFLRPRKSSSLDPGTFYLAFRCFRTLLYTATENGRFSLNQGNAGVPIPGGVQKPCRCGTWGHGLAGMVVMG